METFETSLNPPLHPNCSAWKGNLDSSWRTPGSCEDPAIAEIESLVPRDWSTSKRKIQTCLACQANSTDSHPEPLQMSAPCPTLWHTVHTEFCGPFSTGGYLLVVIDAYSRFPEVNIVRSTSPAAIIPKLDQIFATHGIPWFWAATMVHHSQTMR